MKTGSDKKDVVLRLATIKVENPKWSWYYQGERYWPQ